MHALGVLFPDAADCNLQYLREIVAWQEERHRQRLEKERLKEKMGEQIVSRLPPEQVKQALNEFVQWRKRKKGLKPNG